jgi:hypothetical protein
MNRNAHRFQFSGKQIADAAGNKKGYHERRLSFWKEEHTKAIELARTATVEVREYAVTGGSQAQIVIDQERANRVGQCASKIASHRTSAERFAIEGAAYATQADRAFELDPDDVTYFGIVGGYDEREDA